MHKISIAFAMSLIFAACGAAPAAKQDKVTRTKLAPEDSVNFRKLVDEADALWAKRDSEPDLVSALQKWEQATQLKDDDWETYAKLTRGYYFLADSFYQFAAMGGGYPYNADAIADQAANEKYLNAHLRGLEMAQRGMSALSPEFEKLMNTGGKIEDAIGVIGREGVPLIYWYASNMGKWSKAKGIATVLKHKDRIFKMASHVHEIAPDYYHAAADRYFGAFYAVAPSFAGGDLDRSQDHFNASMKAAPKYMGTYVLAAELYATKNQNPQVFERYLNTVIQAPADIIPELAPETAVEKKKAEALLKAKDDLF